MSFRWGRYLNRKGITINHRNSYKGFRAGLRKYFDKCHKNFDTPFSVLLHKDQEKLEKSTKGGKTAKRIDIMKYRKVFVDESVEIIRFCEPENEA